MVLWVVVLLMILDNLGVNITTLVASLGIGGIAVALAVQNILGDLFASLSIVLDKPFVLGDFIIVDKYLGSVEYVGLKTTRLRSLGGEQLVFSNADLLKSRLQNMTRMTRRRAVFSVAVTYATPTATLRAIPPMLTELVKSQENATFDRAHFSGVGPSSMNFEVVYWVESADYNKFMDIQQEIYLQMLDRLAEMKVELALPTQTLQVRGLEAGPPESAGAGADGRR
jgi:small-conductance mechanosensitive channel